MEERYCQDYLFPGWKCKIGNREEHKGLPCALKPRWWNIRGVIRYYLR